jgi:hypothetical protein
MDEPFRGIDEQFAGDAIPIVNPADLKGAWAMLDEVEASHSGQAHRGQNVAMGVSKSLWEKSCSPGADTHAVFMRVSILRTLKNISVFSGHPLPWLHDGKPDDAMFELFATGRALEEFQKIMKEA